MIVKITPTFRNSKETPPRPPVTWWPMAVADFDRQLIRVQTQHFIRWYFPLQRTTIHFNRDVLTGGNWSRTFSWIVAKLSLTCRNYYLNSAMGSWSRQSDTSYLQPFYFYKGISIKDNLPSLHHLCLKANLFFLRVTPVLLINSKRNSL